MSILRDFEGLYRAVRRDVFDFCKALNFTPTWQQADILKAYQRAIDGDSSTAERQTSVKSGQGGGKTAIENVIAAHWVLRFKGARMRILGASIDQLKDTWMAEFRMMLDRAEPVVQSLFECRMKDILVCGDIDWSIRLVPAKDVGKVLGRHHPHLAFIVDEVSEVERDILEAIMGTLKNEDRYFGLFGNPWRRDNYQFDTFNAFRRFWWTYTIDVEQSPLADRVSIEQLRIKYGEDSDIFQVSVRGNFPSKNPQAVMSSDDLEACHAKNKDQMLELVRAGGLQKRMGIDFARFGNDASVIARRSGLWLFPLEFYVKREPLDVIGEAFLMQREAKWRDDEVLYIPDMDGLGGGAGGAFRGKKVYEFHSQSADARDPMFRDLLTESFFHLGELVKRHEVYVPDDPLMIRDLSTRNYYMTRQGKIIIESKDEWKKRMQTAQSPDRGDAVVLCFAPVGPLTAQIASMAPPDVSRDQLAEAAFHARPGRRSRVAGSGGDDDGRIGGGPATRRLWTPPGVRR